jgi:hypothetical protein
MRRSTFTRLSAVWFLAAGLPSCISLGVREAAAAEETVNAPAADPRLDMVKALEALGPHPSLGDQAKVFGRLASTARFTGGAVGDDRIVLDTPDLGAEDTRWSFIDIRPDSFVFRDEASSDGGKSWRLQSDYHMKRRGAVSPQLR